MLIDLIRPATTRDVDAVVALVNQAYRPQAKAAGWTDEAELVVGDRISPAQIQALLANTKATLLLGFNEQALLACLLIEAKPDGVHFGLFAVRPEQQGAGLGGHMLQAAESYAQAHYQPQQYVMHVLSARSSLLAFYARRGYVPSGAVMDYPLAMNVGTPKYEGLQVLELLKTMSVEQPCGAAFS